MPRRTRSKYIADVKLLGKGVAGYYTATGAFVFHANWRADPLKTEAWADMVASSIAGGRHSAYFLREFEADDDARQGDRIFWAFSPDRNIIAPRPIPRDWPVYLGADFGETDPTSIVFLAQDPSTRHVYVFDSIYTKKGLDPQVKELIYRKLATHFDITMEQLRMDGAHRWVAGAQGDRAAPEYISFYQMEPWPINFAGREDVKHRTNRATESKVNRGFWPSMPCCGVRHMADKEEDTDDEPLYSLHDGEEAIWKKCPLCEKWSVCRPAFYLIEGAAPQLAEQLESLANQEAPADGFDSPEKKKRGEPDHATDSFKYIANALNWEGEAAPGNDEVQRREREQLEAKPAYARTVIDSMKLMVMRAADRQKQDEERMRFGSHRRLTASRWGTGRGIKYRNPGAQA